jgi:hypothetical protein
MKDLGLIVIAIGLVLGYYAFDMDISVKVSNQTTNLLGTERVSNLSKMNEQQNLVIASAALCIMGTILFSVGMLERKLFPDPINPNVSSNAGNMTATPEKSDDSNLTPSQKELKAKYERSEISLEEYTKEWNKLY